MIATLPHFYKAEHLLDGIESGLSPNKTFHELFVHLEIVSFNKIGCARKDGVDLVNDFHAISGNRRTCIGC